MEELLMLVVFSGGSGVGKNTIIEKLLQEGDFELLPTYTTREQRPNESYGHPYYFITEDEFKTKIELNELFEYNVVHDHYYGTSRVLFENKTKSGKILLKDIDVLGTQNLVETLGKLTTLLTIFLRVDSKDILVERLKGRNEQEIDKRLERYEMEQSYQSKYDFIVTNNSLEETMSVCYDIVYHVKNKSFLKSTQTIRNMNQDKIYKIAAVLKEDSEKIPPIDVCIKDHELYIIDGHHRYLASLLTGKKIAANIVVPKYFDEVTQYDWEDSIEFFSRGDI